MCFVLGKLFLLCNGNANLITLKNLQYNSVFGRRISKINNIYFISNIKGIKLRIDWINTIYYASIVHKEISICNLLHHKMGHPAYIITHSEHNMKFLNYWSLIEPNCLQNWHLRNIWRLFIYPDFKLRRLKITIY